MTRTLRKYIAQAEALGACDDAVWKVGHCHTVDAALNRINDSDAAWVLAFMDLSDGLRKRVAKRVTSAGAADILVAWTEPRGSLRDSSRLSATRRDELLRHVDSPIAASDVLFHAKDKLPKRWQDRLTRIAEEASQ